MSRIVVITNGNYQARVILGELFERRHADIAGVAIISGDYFGRSGLTALRAIARVTAFPYVLAKIVQMVAIRVAAVVAPRALLSVERLAERYGTPCVEAVSVKDPGVDAALAGWNADLLVSVSCPQKIPQSLVDRFRLGGINIHSSLLPKYAGLAPYYWVLAESERTTGTSVHYLTQKFDDGHLLAVRELEVRPGESAFGLFHRLCIEGRGALCEAVERAESSDPGVAQPKRGRSYRSNPDMASYRRLRRNGHAIIRIRQLLSTIAREMQSSRQAPASIETP